MDPKSSSIVAMLFELFYISNDLSAVNGSTESE